MCSILFIIPISLLRIEVEECGTGAVLGMRDVTKI